MRYFNSGLIGFCEKKMEMILYEEWCYIKQILMKQYLHSMVEYIRPLCVRAYLGRSMRRHAARIPKMKKRNFLYHESAL